MATVMPWRTLRYLLTARCKETTRAASDECDGHVSRVDWWAARLHWLACAPCRRSCSQIFLVDRLLKSLPSDYRESAEESELRLSAEASRRIRESLDEARRGNP